MPVVHDVLTTANTHVHDVLTTPRVHDVLTIDTYGDCSRATGFSQLVHDEVM